MLPGKRTQKARKAEPQPIAALSRIYGLAPATVVARLAAHGIEPDEIDRNGKAVSRRWLVTDAVHAALSGSKLPWGASTGRMDTTPGAVLDLTEQRARLAKAQADERVIIVETLRGDRVAKDEIKDHLVQSFSVMKQAVDAIPGRCADGVARETGLEPGRVREILLAEINEIESNVSGKIFEWAARYRESVGGNPGGAGEAVDPAEGQVS